MSTIISIKDWLDQHPDHSETDKRLYLTEEEVKSFPQFKDATPEEIENIIDTLHNLALTSYHLFCREMNNKSAINKAA